MKYLSVVLWIAGGCAGCVLNTAPKGDEGFAVAEGLQALVGCYSNVGEGEGVRYLSATIWPNEKLAHDQITAVQVVLNQPKSLRVTAEAANGPIKESIFTEGEDFHLRSGQIETKSDLMASFLYPAGNVFIGVAYETETLGIDKSGNARLQETGGFAGTGFLIFPLAGHGRGAYRFPKNRTLCE